MKVALKVEGLSASAEVSYGLKGQKELDRCALLCSGLDIRGLSTEVAGGFVGCTVGMYAVAEKSCEDRAWFENFSY